MRALRAHRRTDPTALTVEEAADPVAGTGDVVVEVHGAGYTRGELTWPSTWVDHAGRDRTPTTPGHEVSGIVVAVGFGVVRWSAGDAVFGLTDWYRDGALAERVAVAARDLAPKPAALDHLATATLPLAGLTAWQGIFDHGGVRAGDSVLVTGAGGAVGSLAVQLAHGAGARVVAQCRAPDAEAARGLGADAVVADPGELAGLGAMRVVLDTVGGDIGRAALATLQPSGRGVSIAEPGLPAPDGATSRYFVVEPDRHTLRELAGQVDEGRLVPVRADVYGLGDAAAAIADTEAGRRRGKIVVDLSPAPPPAR